MLQLAALLPGSSYFTLSPNALSLVLDDVASSACVWLCCIAAESACSAWAAAAAVRRMHACVQLLVLLLLLLLQRWAVRCTARSRLPPAS
jgi:hypothetical protein